MNSIENYNEQKNFLVREDTNELPVKGNYFLSADLEPSDSVFADTTIMFLSRTEPNLHSNCSNRFILSRLCDKPKHQI